MTFIRTPETFIKFQIEMLKKGGGGGGREEKLKGNLVVVSIRV